MLLVVISLFAFLPVIFIFVFADQASAVQSLIGAIVLTFSFTGLFASQSVYFNKQWFRFQDMFVASKVSPASYALGLSVSDIGFDRFVPARWSVGNAFTFVPVRNLDAVRRCRVNEPAWDQAFELGGRTSAFVFCGETIDPANQFHARMFAPRLGVAEDPATGSAVAAMGGLCVRTLALDQGEHRFNVEQGHEMGRPSLIELTLTMRSGLLRLATVGGPAIVVSEGTIEA